MTRWSRLQRVGKWNVKRRSLEGKEEVNRMLGEGKKSGITNRPLLFDELRKQYFGGLISNVFGSLSALIICMVQFLFNTRAVWIYFALWLSLLFVITISQTHYKLVLQHKVCICSTNVYPECLPYTFTSSIPLSIIIITIHIHYTDHLYYALSPI